MANEEAAEAPKVVMVQPQAVLLREEALEESVASLGPMRRLVVGRRGYPT
jgi:hypothetical protein